MTGFLASVSSLEEARIALAGGADVIDLKDPSEGVLGAVPLATMRDVVDLIGGRRLVSAALGDLPGEPEVIGSALRAAAATGVAIIKVGLFDTQNRRGVLEALGRHAKPSIVAVLFADREPDVLAAVSEIAGHGLRGVMLDTADKSGASLRSYRTDLDLAAYVEKARGLGLLNGLAGSLRISDIGPLLALAPDYLGFRGALCTHAARTQAIDPMAVRRVRMRIPWERSKLDTSMANEIQRGERRWVGE